MAKALILTEKPSVARDIVAALWGDQFPKRHQAQHAQKGRKPDRGFMCQQGLGHLR